MPTYLTKQRKILMEFLDAHPHENFSVTQVVEYFKGESISTSSVYRNLAELEANGTLRRISKTGAREAYYRYLKAPSCKYQIHLRCRKCDRSFHMRGETTQMLLARVLENDDFIIDTGETVLYGLCKACRAETMEDA